MVAELVLNCHVYFFPHFNTDSQVVGNEHMLTCQGLFTRSFVTAGDLREVFSLLSLFFALSISYIDTVQRQVKIEP